MLNNIQIIIINKLFNRMISTIIIIYRSLKYVQISQFKSFFGFFFYPKF